LSRAEDTSGLDTDVDLDVKRQPKRKHISDESDDDSRSSVFDESSLFRPVAPETLSVSIATQSLSPKGQCTFKQGWHFDMVWQKVFCRDSGKNSKGKVFPYSLPSVGPGADPSVQAVSPQVT